MRDKGNNILPFVAQNFPFFLFYLGYFCLATLSTASAAMS